MALSFEAAEELIYEFCKTYPQARTITYNLAQTQEEIYGPENTVALRGRISGSYRAASCGADFALANSDSNEKFERTLRHEILGHFGINTFKPDEKRAVLNAIIEARSEVGLETLWGYVDRLYPGQSDMRNAEEVYALACEAIEPSDRSAAIDGQKSYDDVCVSRTRAMRISDLINLTTMVAEGLHDSTRSQQTFPESDSAQFKQDTPMKISEYPVWLAVQPDDREKMRAAAGQLSDGRSAVAWDKEEKLWYARPGCDLDRINEWLPDRSMRAGGGDPEAEFFDTLTQAGLVIKGMPVMNGKRQRVPTTDDKGGKTSGVYCGYLDRRPAGWFINYHRAESSKDVTNWTATGGDANPLARLHIRAAAKQSQEDATRERAELHAERTLAAKTLYDQLPAADPSHPYLVRKGIPPTPELRQTRNGALVVPFFSAQGNFKTLQYIPETGDKLLFKDAPKKGNYLVVGGPLEPGQPILYAEGYATARSLNMATERPVVMTIDAGNMVTVAQILHQQFPGSPHVFLADFDHAKDENKGLIMATEAAAKVEGQVLYPAFNEREIAQGFTDFNDLHQSRGLDAVRDQTAALFAKPAEVLTPQEPQAIQRPSLDDLPISPSESGAAMVLKAMREPGFEPELLGMAERDFLTLISESVGGLTVDGPGTVVAIPLTWTGRLQTDAWVIDSDTLQLAGERPPDFFSVHAENDQGQFVWIADCETKDLAEELSHRLLLIDAYGQRQGQDIAAKLTAINIPTAPVDGQVLSPSFNESAQSFTDFHNPQPLGGPDAVRDQAAPEYIRHDEVTNVPDPTNAATPGVFLTPKIRNTLEKEWSALQSDFFKQQLQIADQLKTDLRTALKAEKTELKSQDTQSLTFGERVAASVGLMEPGSNGLQIAHLNLALKQLNMAEHEGWTTRSFDGQRMKLQEAGEYAIKMGKPIPAATGDLAKDRDTWVSEQAAARLTGAGLAPLIAVDINAQAAQFAEQVQARVGEIVQQAKEDPFRTVDLANLALQENVQDHATVQAQRFSPKEVQASVAIDARAEAYADVTAPSPDAGVAQEPVSPEDTVKWASFDVQDLAVIQAQPLREMASETMVRNTQSAPLYAEQIEAAGIDLAPQASAAEQLTPSVSQVNVPAPTNAEAPGVFLTSKIRQTLEREWGALQGDFFKQQIQLADQLKTDLRAALKAEKTELKSQDTQSLTFGERIAASVGLTDPGSNGLQIHHINLALKQLNNAEHEGYTTRSFDGQRMKLQEAGEYAIKMGKPIPVATGDLAKDRDTWVSEQAAMRLTGAGLAPLVAVDTSAQAAQFAEQMQARISEIVSEAKQDPFRTVGLATLTLHQSVQGHADTQAQRFSLEELQGSVPIFTRPDAYADVAPFSRFTPEELQGSVAISTRADAYADAVALSPDGSFAPATVATEDVVKWADLDVKDLAVIQAEPLREMATETMIGNTQLVPVYAEQIAVAGVNLTAQAPAAEQLAPNVSPEVRPAPGEPEAPAVSAERAPEANNDQEAPAAEAVAPLVETAPAPVADTRPAAVESTPSINAEGPPASVNVEVAPGVSETAVVNALPDHTVQAPTTTAEAPLANLTAASVVSNDPATPVASEFKQAVPETAQSSPVQQTVAASPSAQVDEPVEPVLIAPTVVASAASAAEPDAPAQMTEDLAALMPRRPDANEAPAAETVMNFIDVGPRIGKDEPPLQPSQIDKDSLLTRITPEPQGDNSVLYKLDNEPAFVDRGSRLEMVPGAGQSDEKILAALLTAARFYRGQIELTGSDAFKAKAIELIAQNQVNVSMKNPAQQLMLDQSRQALNLPVVKADAIHGETPAPFDPVPPAAVATNTAATASGTAPLSPALPEQQAAPTLVNTAANNVYVPLDVSGPVSLASNAAQAGPVDDAPPLGSASLSQEIKPGVQDGSKASGTGVDPAIHQLSTSAVEGVTGKVMSCGKAPFRFDPANSESVHITLRTKTGIQTFWGKELAGLLRETRIEPGRMATLQYLGEKPVTVQTPVKDQDTGLVLHYVDKQAKRNQWSLGLLNGTAVRTGDDQGVKLVAYDAARFAMIQNSIMSQLNVPIEAPPRPADGLFWMTPNGQGSAKAGDGLSAPRPPVDDVNVGKPIMSSWSQDGQLDMALFRGDGPYLQGVMRQGNEYQHVLVSLPGHAEAPPMVINQITEQGLVPIGVGNGINRSSGEPVAREHIAFKLDGDQAVRIGKLDFPAEVPPALHVRLGFDERWKDTNTLPKSSPAAAPMAEPSALRPS